MKIQIICVGKLKEKFLIQGCNEYNKRITPYAKISVIELAEEVRKEPLSPAEIDQLLTKEAKRSTMSSAKQLQDCPCNRREANVFNPIGSTTTPIDPLWTESFNVYHWQFLRTVFTHPLTGGFVALVFPNDFSASIDAFHLTRTDLPCL